MTKLLTSLYRIYVQCAPIAMTVSDYAKLVGDNCCTIVPGAQCCVGGAQWLCTGCVLRRTLWQHPRDTSTVQLFLDRCHTLHGCVRDAWVWC